MLVQLHPPVAERGFTLIELVSCVVIIGILGAVSGAKFLSNQPFQERGYIDEVAGALRYAQRVAVASGCDVSITTNAGGYQALQRSVVAGNTCALAGAWTTPVARSDGTQLTGSPPPGVVIAPAAQIVFDSQGRVSNGTPPPVRVAAFTLTVDPGSGLVAVQ